MSTKYRITSTIMTSRIGEYQCLLHQLQLQFTLLLLPFVPIQAAIVTGADGWRSSVRSRHVPDEQQPLCCAV